GLVERIGDAGGLLIVPRVQGVVPVAVPVVAGQRQGLPLPVADLDSGVVAAGVKIGAHPQPGAGGGRGDGAHADLLADPRPAASRQFVALWDDCRCSILFHLEVPGGKWHTVISSPVSTASAASSAFHARVRYPLEPPASAVISSRRAAG